MECPHCHRDISDTAVRCVYCRRPVKEELREHTPYLAGDLIDNIKRRVSAFLLGGKAAAPCPWTFLDALAIAVLIGIFVFSDPFHLGANILRYLRLHYFIFTREPKLLYYLTVYINTILLKGVSLAMLIVLVRSRRVSFWDTVVSSGKVPDKWEILMPLYIGLCVLFQVINRANPLVPNIPFNSVFIEAKIIGNVVIIFAVLYVAPVVEEVLFRGFFYPALNRYMGMYPAIILTSLLFTLAHYPQVKNEYVFGVVIFILSFVITYARAKTGSTRLAIVMHHLYNLICVGTGFIEYMIVRY